MNIDSLNLKPIKDFDGYFISDCGKVVSTKYNKKRILKTTYGKKVMKMLIYIKIKN